MPRFALVALVALVLAFVSLLAGCDMLGVESPEKTAALRDADGRAVGGACRHAARAIEDCYALNKRANKSAVFAGWREMNDYMRENKIEPVTPQFVAGAGAGADTEARGGGAASSADERASNGGTDAVKQAAKLGKGTAKAQES